MSLFTAYMTKAKNPKMATATLAKTAADEAAPGAMVDAVSVCGINTFSVRGKVERRRAYYLLLVVLVSHVGNPELPGHRDVAVCIPRTTMAITTPAAAHSLLQGTHKTEDKTFFFDVYGKVSLENGMNMETRAECVGEARAMPSCEAYVWRRRT